MVLDMKSAFLYGETKMAIYLELPMKERNGGNPELVGTLHKELYGTRDAPTAVAGSTTLNTFGLREIT